MLGPLINWGPSVLRFVSKYVKDKETLDDFSNAANTLDWIGDVRNKVQTGKSIQSSAARSLISPMIVFEESMTHLDYMNDLLTIITLRDIKDALTHLSLEGTVGGLKISRLVNQINPNRAAGYMSLVGSESFGSSKSPNFATPNNNKRRTIVNVSSNDMNNLTEYTPFALGKTVRAETMIAGKEVGFFLTFRPIPIPASTENIRLMFSAVKNKDVGWNARLEEYKAGGITRPELLTGTDAIKREFNIRNNEISGYYSEVMERENNNIRESIRTGIVSMNQLANTVIISRDTANAIEDDLELRFNSPKINTIRRAMRANTIVIVDDQYGVFEFYRVGDPIPVKYTLQQIKTKSKKEDTGSLESLIKLLSGR